MSAVWLYLAALHAAGVAWALLASRQAPRMRGFGPLVVGALLVMLAASAGNTMYAAAVIQLWTTQLGAGLIFLGLGLVLASLVVRFVPAGRGRWLGGAIVVVVPVLLILSAGIDSATRRKAAQTLLAQQQAAFRLTEVEGTLGGVALRLPASPQIAVRYECLLEGGEHVRICTANFLQGLGPTHAPGGAVPVFHEVALSGRGTACMPRCIEPEVVQAWCAARPDWTDSAWCAATPMDRLTFALKPGLVPGQSTTGRAEWRKVATEGLSLACEEHRGKPFCHAMFGVAPGIHVTALMVDVNMDHLEERAHAARDQAARVWAAMTGG